MKKTLLILTIGWAIFSCETPIDPELPESGSNTVIYSFFRPDTSLYVDVFSAIPILQENVFERNRQVSIQLFADGEFVENLALSEWGSYYSELYPREGVQYTVELQSGDEVVRGTDVIPQAVELLDATVGTELVDFNIGEYGYPAQITFRDPEHTVNYYALEVFVEDCSEGCVTTGISGELNELLIEELEVDTDGSTDVNIGGGPETLGGFRYLYFEDDSFNGEVFSYSFYIVPSKLNFEENNNVQIKFVLKSLSKSHFDYLLTSDYQRQIEEEGSLTEPVQVANNIENGVGAFAGYNYDVFLVRF